MSEEFIAQPQANETEVTQETTQVVENTNPTTETVTEEPKIKIKYNHEERELSLSEARELAQKGLHMDKAVEKAKAETHQLARDSYIAEQKYEWMGKPITTEAQYKQALKESEIYEKLQSQSLPEEVISEILEGRRDREERNHEKMTMKQQQQRDNEYKDFFDYFASENDRSFDPAKDVIPDEVWKMVEGKGKSLTDAYQIYESKQYKGKIKELESKLNIQQANETHANTSTGSVTGQGNGGAEYISFDVFQSNRNNQDWVNKNYDKIVKSRAKWT